MIESFYPVIMSDNIERSVTFFKEVFDFEETFVSEWYISLKGERGFELALIDRTHETIPDDYRGNCKGLILNFEVNNVDILYEAIVAKRNIPILMKVKDEDFGQRHFIVESPDKILIDIIQVIPPTDEYLANYAEADNETK